VSSTYLPDRSELSLRNQTHNKSLIHKTCHANECDFIKHAFYIVQQPFYYDSYLCRFSVVCCLLFMLLVCYFVSSVLRKLHFSTDWAQTPLRQLFVDFLLNKLYIKLKNLETRGVDLYGTGGRRPPDIWTGGHNHECPPQYFWSNISYFLCMQYFLDKLKEFLVFLVFSRLIIIIIIIIIIIQFR